jgi:hypothetical protein
MFIHNQRPGIRAGFRARPRLADLMLEPLRGWSGGRGIFLGQCTQAWRECEQIENPTRERV